MPIKKKPAKKTSSKKVVRRATIETVKPLEAGVYTGRIVNAEMRDGRLHSKFMVEAPVFSISKPPKTYKEAMKTIEHKDAYIKRLFQDIENMTKAHEADRDVSKFENMRYRADHSEILVDRLLTIMASK